MTSSHVRRALAIMAMMSALLAAVAGSPHRARRASIDVEELAAAVAHEEDHVTALELAAWIRDRKPGLRVLDVRSPADFDDDHGYRIPTAEHVPIESLASAPFRTTDTLVLYSNGGAHAAQAWVFLRALGHRKVFFLRGGLEEWLDEVMTPTPAANTPAGVAALSRYFGGVPRVGDEKPLRDRTATRRRGC